MNRGFTLIELLITVIIIIIISSVAINVFKQENDDAEKVKIKTTLAQIHATSKIYAGSRTHIYNNVVYSGKYGAFCDSEDVGSFLGSIGIVSIPIEDPAVFKLNKRYLAEGGSSAKYGGCLYNAKKDNFIIWKIYNNDDNFFCLDKDGVYKLEEGNDPPLIFGTRSSKALFLSFATSLTVNNCKTFIDAI